MIRLIRILLAWPFSVLGTVLTLLNARDAAAPLLRLAWHIGGDPTTGAKAVVATERTRGVGPACELAVRWADRRPGAMMLGVAGLYLARMDRPDEVPQYLERARALPNDPLGVVDRLEVHLAELSGDEALLDLYRAWQRRRDLTPDLAALAQGNMLWDDLLEGRFDQARAGARRLLSIADQTVARMVLWTLALREGRAEEAEDHFRCATDVATRDRCLALGCWVLGDVAGSREALARAEQANPIMARNVAQTLARHQEGRP